MILLRHRQRALTAVNPHADNRRYAIPRRNIKVIRPQLGIHMNMDNYSGGVRLPEGRDQYDAGGFSGLRFPGGTYANYYRQDDDGSWGYDPIGDVDAQNQLGITSRNNFISAGNTWAPADMQGFLRLGDPVIFCLNVFDPDGQDRWAGLWANSPGIELGNECYIDIKYSNIVADFAEYKVRAQSAQALWRGVHAGAVFAVPISTNDFNKFANPPYTEWDNAIEADSGWFDKIVPHIYPRIDILVHTTPEAQMIEAITFFDANWNDVTARWGAKGLWVTEWNVIMVNDTGTDALDAFHATEFFEYWVANVLLTFMADPTVEFASLHTWRIFLDNPLSPGLNAFRKLANIPGEVATVVNDATEHIVTIGAMTATLKKQVPYSFTVTPT